MGISGHMLGPRKLRRLRALTGLPLDRAYIRGRDCQGVVWTEDACQHYSIDPRTGEHELVQPYAHWWTCNPRNRPEVPTWR